MRVRTYTNLFIEKAETFSAFYEKNQDETEFINFIFLRVLDRFSIIKDVSDVSNEWELNLLRERSVSPLTVQTLKNTGNDILNNITDMARVKTQNKQVTETDTFNTVGLTYSYTYEVGTETGVVTCEFEDTNGDRYIVRKNTTTDLFSFDVFNASGSFIFNQTIIDHVKTEIDAILSENDALSWV